MGVLDIFDDKEGGILKQNVTIKCNNCNKECISTADAVYRQHRRGKEKFTCKSCAAKRGWTPSKREKARNRSLRYWQNPQYAGGITGKAMAKQIIHQVENQAENND